MRPGWAEATFKTLFVRIINKQSFKMPYVEYVEVPGKMFFAVRYACQ